MSLLRFFANEYREYMQRQYAFCPTGKGGGIDNSCSPTGEPGMGSDEPVTLYRGWATGGQGHYFTPDKDWALQFTQSGRESEVQKIQLKQSEIYRARV